MNFKDQDLTKSEAQERAEMFDHFRTKAGLTVGVGAADEPKSFPESSTGAQREKLNDLDYSLIPFECLEAVARVLKFGAEKYSAGNWEKGLPITQIQGSILRHVFAYCRGEDRDPESGLLHTDHIMFNACALAFNAYHMAQDEAFALAVDDRRIDKMFKSIQEYAGSRSHGFGDIEATEPQE